MFVEIYINIRSFFQQKEYNEKKKAWNSLTYECKNTHTHKHTQNQQ